MCHFNRNIVHLLVLLNKYFLFTLTEAEHRTVHSQVGEKDEAKTNKPSSLIRSIIFETPRNQYQSEPRMVQHEL